MSSPSHHTLSQEQRLKRRTDIQALFSESTAFTAYPLRVVYRWVELPTAAGVKMGVAVSTRQFKKAHDRNRVKRLLREAYRLQQHELQALALSRGLQLQVFFMYVDKVLPTFAPLFDKMRYCLKRLRKTQEDAQ